MERYKISVIIPVYNTEKFLNKCLDSVVNQTIFEEMEIICINDASLDNSLQILKEYEKRYSNIIVIDLKENLKQGGARNKGIEQSTGEYLGFIDSDDYIDSKMYEKLYIKAKTTNADIVCCDYFEVRKEEKKYTKSFKDEVIGKITEKKRKELILNSQYIWCQLFKSDMIKGKIKFPEKIFFEDNYFAPMTIMRSNKIEKVKEALYFYRQDNISTTRSKNNYNFFGRLLSAELLFFDIKEVDKKLYKNVYKEEIEFLFIKLYFLNTIMGTYRFDKYPQKYIEEMKMKLPELLPAFRKNKYLNCNLKAKIKISLLYNFPKIIWYFLRIKYSFLES